MAYGLRSRKHSIAWFPGYKGESGSALNYPGDIKSFRILTPDMIDAPMGVGAYWAGRKRVGGSLYKLDFRTEWRGAGTATLAADRGAPICALFRACGLSEALSGSAGTKGATMAMANPHFTDDSTAGDTDPIDITFYVDTRKQIATNCVGNAVITFEAGKIPYIDWSFTGLYTAVETEGAITTSAIAADTGASATQAAPAPWIAGALAVSAATSGAFTGEICKKITIDLGAQIKITPDGSSTKGYAIPRITHFMPKLKMDLETTALATFNWETVFNAAEQISVSWDHQSGSTSGADGVGCTFTTAGYLDNIPGLEDDNGILSDTLELSLVKSDLTAGFTFAFAST